RLPPLRPSLFPYTTLFRSTRVVAFPVASNAVGTVTDVKRIVELAHVAGALAWADAVHYAPHGPIVVADLGVDVLICSPYKYFDPDRKSTRLNSSHRTISYA